MNEIIRYINRHDEAYGKCPQCGTIFEREYLNYCHHCGLKLSWKNYILQEKKEERARAQKLYRAKRKKINFLHDQSKS